MDLLQLGSRDQIFLEDFYIMGYNLKNARKGRSRDGLATKGLLYVKFCYQTIQTPFLRLAVIYAKKFTL